MRSLGTKLGSLVLGALALGLSLEGTASALSRDEVLSRAKGFTYHPWRSGAANRAPCGLNSRWNPAAAWSMCGLARPPDTFYWMRRLWLRCATSGGSPRVRCVIISWILCSN